MNAAVKPLVRFYINLCKKYTNEIIEVLCIGMYVSVFSYVSCLLLVKILLKYCSLIENGKIHAYVLWNSLLLWAYLEFSKNVYCT